jgi:hypothetical protein
MELPFLGRMTYQCANSTRVTIAHILGEPKVDDLNLLVIIDAQVLRLNVAMYNFLVVHVLDRRRSLHSNLCHVMKMRC